MSQKKFKVNVIEMLLKNNKVAKYGDLVSEDQLSSKADDLKEKGFIVTLTKSDLDKIAKDEKDAASKAKETETAKKAAEDEAANKEAEVNK